MTDKLNPNPRNGSPLFSPESHDFGLTNGSGGQTRRKFLKRTGGATLATSLAWLATHRNVDAAVKESDEHHSDGVWRIKAIPFGDSTMKLEGAVGEPPIRVYDEAVVDVNGDGTPLNPNLFDWDYDGETYYILLKYRLYIAHDDDLTDSTKEWKTTAKNVGWICFREEVFYYDDNTQEYISAKEHFKELADDVLPSPDVAETMISLTKEIDQNGEVTTIGRDPEVDPNLPDYVDGDNELKVDWILDNEGEPTDSFKVTYNNTMINEGAIVDEIDFIKAKIQAPD